MKFFKQKNRILLLFVFAIIASCKPVAFDPLPSWNDTPEKNKIIDFIENVVPQIPVEDRLAVFDMDGTIACESPLWMEMYCAVQGLCMQVGKDSSLLQYPMYQYAMKLRENPKDTSVTNHWGSSIQDMVQNAFKTWDNEAYISFCTSYLDTAMNRDYNITLAKTFYPPMLELLTYLKANNFDVYIVSGSIQGLIWSVCPNIIGFDRQHLIGTAQSMDPVYHTGQNTAFILKPEIFLPSNNNDGKSQNIYKHIGKTPVFAFGNTTGDWGMFHLTSTNTLPNISFLLNHDDSTREYVYPPWHGAPCDTWKDTMSTYGWNIVNMAENFKTVF